MRIGILQRRLAATMPNVSGKQMSLLWPTSIKPSRLLCGMPLAVLAFQAYDVSPSDGLLHKVVEARTAKVSVSSSCRERPVSQSLTHSYRCPASAPLHSSECHSRLQLRLLRSRY